MTLDILIKADLYNHHGWKGKFTPQKLHAWLGSHVLYEKYIYIIYKQKRSLLCPKYDASHHISYE